MFSLPVEVEMIRLDKGQHKQQGHLSINPLGKASAAVLLCACSKWAPCTPEAASLALPAPAASDLACSCTLLQQTSTNRANSSTLSFNI